MQENSTSSPKTDLSKKRKRLKISQNLNPKTETLQEILKFASVYRVEKIDDNQHIEWYLN